MRATVAIEPVSARIALVFVWLTLGAWTSVQAEPYFAVREGLACVACHVNPSGGGLRNTFGTTWGQTVLPAQRIEEEGLPMWTGALGDYLRIGGNLRSSATHADVPPAGGSDGDATSEFDLEELRLYLDLAVIPGRLAIYFDQRVAPGGSTNLETYVRYASPDQHWQLKAGQLYLPYGLRLEDDSAFIRQVTGIGFATPDQGVELGWESPQWSAQLAVTNGAAAGAETDEGKQASLTATYLQPSWRVGGSFNFNDSDAGERRMQGLFAGVRTGPVAWLAEADYIVDDGFAEGRRRLWVGLVEGNWSVRRGHNLKLTAEYFDPDTDVDEDEQNRFSAIWEYTPFQFLQLRLGARVYDGIPQNALQNRRLYFLALNGYF